MLKRFLPAVSRAPKMRKEMESQLLFKCSIYINLFNLHTIHQNIQSMAILHPPAHARHRLTTLMGSPEQLQMALQKLAENMKTEAETESEEAGLRLGCHWLVAGSGKIHGGTGNMVDIW